jgi:dihydroorotase
MKTLVRSAVILDPRSAHHGMERDVLIGDGIIERIESRIEETSADLITAQKLFLTPGWIDLRANFRDPGAEHKESLETGSKAARRGGFTRVVLMPSTSPPTHSKSGIEYLLGQARSLPVKIYPTGALSQDMEGRQLTEMYDMHSSGAIAFTDDKYPTETQLMVRALEYTRSFGGLVMTFPFDPGVNPGAMMHEGPTSTSMGLKGLSPLSEELRLHRDLRLLAYCGGRLHVSLISTAGSVDLIRRAKQDGLAVTCAVAAHQFSYTDTDLESFDSNLKVIPPFRSNEDRLALIAGLMDGTIDAICSDHSPEDFESKAVEWEYASYGINGIETAFCTAFTELENHLALEELVRCFTSGPARVLGVSENTIREGSPAEITLFSASENTRIDSNNRSSRSMNNPFYNRTLRGRVILPEWLPNG